VIHLYAICAAPPPLPALAGVDGTALAVQPVDGLALVVSRHTDGVSAAEGALLEHAAVVDALVASGVTLLPARFGRGYATDAALTAAVREHGAALRNALANVAGCVELGVRAAEHAEERPAGAPESASAYMRMRLANVQRLDRLAEEIHEPLAAISRDSVHRVVATERLELTGAYLVPRDDVSTFRTAFDAVAAAHPDVSLVCTGPWPPYSFANVRTDDR
jgi:hypothetical protein